MKKSIRFGVVGAGGRVGRELLSLIMGSEEMIPSFGLGNKAEGFLQNVNSFDKINPESADIVIDFSSPDLFLQTLDFCLKEKTPLVSGTTGLQIEHFKRMKEASQNLPILWAPNMSLGIAVLKNSMKVFRATKDFDFQVEEWHHRHKKDSPSGTAIFLQAELESIIEKPCPPIMAMRSGGIYGVHKVYAVSDEEMITFEHTALNRTVFARGALVGALWLLDKTNGQYHIDDVIS
jgi:4-hydroxy-tetrahydrodipicolinate reductase